MASTPESIAEESRGVSKRGLPPKDRTIDPRQAAQIEAARLKALAPGTYRHPDGSPPERQDFEAFSRQYDQMANERHVWRFARPDGSTYETSWRGLGTGTTAQASAGLLGHRVIGEVIPGPTVEGTPARDAGGRGREPGLTPPPLVQAEIQTPRQQSKSGIDDKQRGTDDNAKSINRNVPILRNPDSPQATSKTTPTYRTVAEWHERALNAAGIIPTQCRPDDGFARQADVVVRVYRYYTRTYNQDRNRNLLWAGMAKLAGGVVFEGLVTGQKWFDRIDDAVTSPSRNDPVTLARLATPTAKEVQIELLRIQKHIFFDLAWQHQAYIEEGLPALEYISKLGADVRIQAWRDIASSDPKRVQEGNRQLLLREQSKIIEPHYMAMRAMWGSSVMTAVISRLFSKSPIPGGRDFNDVVPGGDVTKFGDRWVWLDLDMLPAYLKLSPAARTELVNMPLKDIAPYLESLKKPTGK